MDGDFIRFLKQAGEDLERGIDKMAEVAQVETEDDGVFMRSDRIKFRRDVLIRNQVFASEGEAALADMSTEQGVMYMEAVNLMRNAFGG